MTAVETAAGAVRGRSQGGVRSYLGIPYAAPPVGERRFRPPQPVARWGGERDATEFGPRCPQVFSMLAPGREPEDEDCLNLNVWTGAQRGDSLPVLVWIHGGSFTSGSGSISWYDGARLAARGVVVVTLNYRLGPLGFLHLEPLGGERFAGSANLGLADQSFALRWVVENIAEFGGDPSNVSLFGESAGAMSVSCHPALTSSKGLFRRIIAQSGAAGHVQDDETAVRTAEVVLDHVGIGAGRVHELEDVPAAALVAAVAAADAAAGRSDLPLPFRPTVETTSMPVAPLEVCRGGALSGREAIIGTTEHEMRVFGWAAAMGGGVTPLDDERLHRRVARVVSARGSGRDPREVIDTYRRRRDVNSPADVWMAMGTDLTFRVPALTMAEALGEGGATVHMYRFDEPSTAFDGALGAAHGLEIPYVFDNLDQPGVEFMLGSGDADRHRLAAATASAWAGFARDGSPTMEGVGPWPRWNGSGANLVLRRSARVSEDLDDEVRALWM